MRWKKPIKSLIELHPEDAENAQDIDGNTDDNYSRVEMPFFEGSDGNDLIQCMVAHIKAQVENLLMPKSGFTLDKIMHLYINFHRLVLTQCGSYNELPT